MGAGIIFVAAGLFSVIASVLDWNWWDRFNRSHWFWINFSKRTTRIFHLVLGILMVLVGVLILTGIITEHR